jgi:HEXXH motif-containing protein
MRLDERRWVLGGGLTREWDWVMRRRVEDALRRLSAVEPAVRKSAPASVKKRGYLSGLRYLLKTKGRERDRMLAHPCLDYWLFLWQRHFGLPAAEDDWHLQLGLLQHFAAALAVERGDAVALDATLDPDGRLHLYGSPLVLEVPGAGRAPLRVRTGRGGLALDGPGGKRTVPLSSLTRLVEAGPGLAVDDRGWLTVHGVTMHGLATLPQDARERFAAVIRRALEDMAERDPELHAEMTDMLRLLVPLENPMNHGSVSSSYVNLRGLIGLSPSDDPLLQAETLIHEYCHQKMNQLLFVDPVLLPGQSGQVFYSPWRKDARRLRGLVLGAHAFLNVARYLARSLSRETYPEDHEIEIMVNVARRVLQVELALKSVTRYASLTEFGRRFVHAMSAEAGRLQHAILWFPPALLKEQALEVEAHRKEFSVGDTGIHVGAGVADGIPRAAFLTPKGLDETPAPAASA